MRRGTSARREESRARGPDEECPIALDLFEDAERRLERLDAENARLRESLGESEAWYRLLAADHAALQRKHDQLGRKAGELRAEVDRLGSKDREPEALVGRPVGPGSGPRRQEGCINMNRIGNWFHVARSHKWGTAAAVALATLIARDPGVQSAFSAALERARQVGRGDDSSRDPAGSGYVRYAAMIQARDEADRARLEYNEREPGLKGDALLEAQDRLRSAKVRHRQARLAFFPELARRCEQAHLPVPKEAVEALASLKQEARD